MSNLERPDPCPSRSERLEQYLDELCRPIPPLERDDRRREMALHLAALVEAGEEMGLTPAQAVEEAVRQFGAPREMRAAWRRSYRWQRLATAAAAAVLTLSGLGAALVLTAMCRDTHLNLVQSLVAGALPPLVLGFWAARRGREKEWAALRSLAWTPAAALLVTELVPVPAPIPAPDVLLSRVVLWCIAAAATCGLGLLAERRRGPAPAIRT
jgi:hypothetical protein